MAYTLRLLPRRCQVYVHNIITLKKDMNVVQWSGGRARHTPLSCWQYTSTMGRIELARVRQFFDSGGLINNNVSGLL